MVAANDGLMDGWMEGIGEPSAVCVLLCVRAVTFELTDITRGEGGGERQRKDSYFCYFAKQTLHFPMKSLFIRKKKTNILEKKRYIRVYLSLLSSWENKYFNQSSDNVFLMYVLNSTVPHMKYHAQTYFVFIYFHNHCLVNSLYIFMYNHMENI